MDNKIMKRLYEFKELAEFHLKFKCAKCKFEYENKECCCPRCGYKFRQEKEILQYV